MKRFKLLKILALSTITLQLSLYTVNQTAVAQAIEGNLLEVEYKCLDYAPCIELSKDIKIKLNNEEYIPEKIDYDNNILYYKVPNGIYDYEFSIDERHSTTEPNMNKGKVEVNDNGAKINIIAKVNQHDVNVELVSEYIDLDGNIIASPLDYNGKLVLEDTNFGTKNEVDLVHNKGTMKCINHGSYKVDVSMLPNIEETSLNIVHNKDSIRVATKLKSCIFNFEFEESNGEQIKGEIKGDVVNTATGARSSISINLDGSTQLRLPYGTYKLENLKSNEVDLDNTVIDFNSDKQTDAIKIKGHKTQGCITIENLQSNGKPIANSEFVLKGENTEIINKTDENGNLKFTNLELKEYTIQQLSSGDIKSIPSSDIVNIDLKKSNTQSIQIENAQKTTYTVECTPMYNGEMLNEPIKFHIKGLSSTNSFIDRDYETDGTNSIILDLYEGDYEIVLYDVNGKKPVNAVLSNTILKSDSKGTIKWKFDYTEASQVSKGRTVPQTSQMARDGFGVFTALSTISGCLGIKCYRRKEDE